MYIYRVNESEMSTERLMSFQQQNSYQRIYCLQYHFNVSRIYFRLRKNLQRFRNLKNSLLNISYTYRMRISFVKEGNITFYI